MIREVARLDARGFPTMEGLLDLLWRVETLAKESFWILDCRFGICYS